MLKQLTSNTEKLLKIGVFGLFAVLPVIFTSSTVENFEFPKTIFVYIVATTLVVWTYVLKGGFKIKPPLYVWAFLVTYFVATIVSSHFYTSLWGYYSRFNGGFYSILCYFFIYLVISNLFSKNDIYVLKKLIAVCSLPVSLFAIWQHLQFNIGVPAKEFVRVYSTLGQPNWLGAYLACVCMLAFGFVNFEALRKKWLLFSSLFVLAFCGLWFTFSVSSLLGFGIGLVYLALTIKKLNWKRTLVTLAMCLVVALIQPGIWKERVFDVVQSIGTGTGLFIEQVHAQPAQTQNNSFAVSDSGFIRKGIWKGTLNIVRANPKNFLIGTGPETFPYEFQKVRPTELNYSSEWDFILNKPHNYYLEILSTTGILGLVAYLVLIGRVFVKSEKTSRAMLIVIFVTNVFSWPTSIINLLFWGIAGENETN